MKKLLILSTEDSLKGLMDLVEAIDEFLLNQTTEIQINRNLPLTITVSIECEYGILLKLIRSSYQFEDSQED